MALSVRVEEVSLYMSLLGSLAHLSSSYSIELFLWALTQARRDLALGSSVSNLSVEKSPLNHQFPPCLMEQRTFR